METGEGSEHVGKRCAFLPDLTLHTDDSDEWAHHTTRMDLGGELLQRSLKNF